MAGFTSLYVAVVTLVVADCQVVAVPAESVERVETSARGTLHRGIPSSVIRREQDRANKKAQVQLGADGQTKQDLAEVQSHDFETKEKKEDCINFCNKNFVQGDISAEGNNYCDASKKMKLIEDSEICREAAMEMFPDGKGLDKNWLISDEDEAAKFNHPQRCFYTKNDQKWWFNPTGEKPTNPTNCGDKCVPIPVCEKPEYLYDNTTSTCAHDDYKPIDDEDACRAAAKCLMLCSDEYFSLGGTEGIHSSPEGCHVTPGGCVRFNPGKPKEDNIKGNPICKLKTERGEEFVMKAKDKLAETAKPKPPKAK